ncbi:MAG: hypothetical protein ACT4OS_00125 [Acidimicrobiales bacterium]
MKSPSRAVRVRVDGQGRMVLPKWLRDQIVTAPGEIELRSTPDGVLLTPLSNETEVTKGTDGLPVLRLGRAVSNEEVLAAIDLDRSSR